MVRQARGFALALVAVALAPRAFAEDAEKPKPAMAWPLWTMRAPPAGAETTLAAGEALVQLDLEPRGGYAALVVRGAKGGRAGLRLWDFKSAPAAARAGELADRSVDAIAFSAFDATLFVASSGAGGSRIDRFAVDAGKHALRKVATVYSSSGRIASLVTALVEYDGQERLYFAMERARGRSQILSVRGDGTGGYELTSPTGAATELTEAAIRAGDASNNIEPPRVEKAESAAPLSLAPDGTLIWRGKGGALFEQGYEVNWLKTSAVPGGAAQVEEVALPNGYFRERWTKDKPGFELVNRAHGRAESVAADVTFASRPVVATNGRGFLGEVRAGEGTVIRAYAMPRAAAVRVHRQAWLSKETEARLERDGILLGPTETEQIYAPYEGLRYQDSGCGTNIGQYESVFASIDGFLEVLNAGFEAVFMLGEQDASRPALSRVVKELQRVAKAQGKKRLADIGDAAAKLLAGNLKHPEGALVRAERLAQSALPINLDGQKIDYADFKPRGPYVATKTLSNYFRAFKLLNVMQLAPDEKETLAGDAAFMVALRKWVDVQRAYVAGTRHETLFDVGAQRTDLPAACVPERVRQQPPLLYPLAWSMDSEILESSVVRLGVGPSCGSVPNRALPSGLDLLAGLGSPKARELEAPEYKAFPELARSRDLGEKRAAVLASATTFVDSYLRLVQVLSTDTRAPEAVSSDLWQRRLMQTALGAWVGLRHTLVLVSETGAAECDGEAHQFELLTAEPARGVVDPMPEAWRQVGALLDRLAQQTRAHRVADAMTAHLKEQAGVARKLAAMAEKQMRQEPLKAADYKLLEEYAGVIEHPFLLFKSVLWHGGGEGGLPVPDPMSKIVDLQRGPDGTVWHAAVGHPLRAKVLLGDRGVLVPATGAVYSYYEATAGAPMDDKQWREQLPTAKQPAWVAPLLYASPMFQADGSPKEQDGRP